MGISDFTEQDQQHMQRAIELACMAEQQGEVPVGAVITLNDEIIGEGYNQPISTNDPTAHAEIIALRKAAQHVNNYRLINTTLYVTLEPCAMCAGALIHARINRLVFGAQDKRAEAGGINHQLQCQGGLFADDCAALLQRFFQSRRY